MKIISYLSFGLLLVCSTCFAHRDAKLQITSSGQLLGLPHKYEPATLHVAFSSGIDGKSISSAKLQIGEHHLRIPECLNSVFPTQNMSEIQVSGSWHHSETVVPYYISFNFYGPDYNKEKTANSKISLLINLQTAKIIRVTAVIVHDEGTLISQELPIDVHALCPKEKLSNFMQANEDAM